MVFSIDWRKRDTVYRYFLRYGMARPVPSARRRIWIDRMAGHDHGHLSSASVCQDGTNREIEPKGDYDDQFDKLVLGLKTWLVMGYWALVDIVDNANSSKTINEVSKHIS